MSRPAEVRHGVLVVGDANPDLVLRGDVVPRFGQAEQLLDAADLLIGGSAAITAHALARLDRPAALLAALGHDGFGNQMVADLAAASVDTRLLLRRHDIGTGLSVVLTPAGGERAILTLPGAIPTLTPAEIEAALDVPGITHVHVASLYLQPQLIDVLPALLDQARERGLTTSLDTNDDPSGSWRGMERLLPHLDLLLPNHSEAAALGRAPDGPGGARALAAGGPLVVMKDGARGALAVRPDGTELFATTTPVTPRDTIGAGDAFDAAFLDGWLDGLDLEACLTRAQRAGALVVGAVGATAGQPTRKDLDPPTAPQKDVPR